MITNRRISSVTERNVKYEQKIKFKPKIKSILIEYIGDNIKEIVCTVALFLIGIIISTIFINNVTETQKNEISAYVQDYISNVKEGKNINQKAVFWDSIKNDAIFTIILWIAGLTIIGIPIVYITIIFKGFTLGYAISALIAIFGIGKGSLFVLGGMLLQNLIAIPAIFGVAVSGIRIYKAIVKGKRKDNIKLEICRHTIISLVSFNILIIESFVTAYISTALVENIIKIL